MNVKGPDMLDRGVLANRHDIGLFEESLTCRVHFNTYIASASKATFINKNARKPAGAKTKSIQYLAEKRVE